METTIRKRDNRAPMALLLLVTAVCVWQLGVSVIFNRPEALNTVLIGAILHGDATRVHSALTRGAQANARMTPTSLHDLLLGSAQTQQSEQALAGKNWPPSALALALNVDQFNHPMPSDITTARIVRDLLDHGADLGTSEDMSAITDLSALSTTAARGYASTAQLLLDRGADVNARDPGGATALFAASFAGRKEQDTLFRLLIDRGADVNAATTRGQTVLMWACQHRNPDPNQIARLLAGGAKVNVADRQGKTALMIAVMNNHNEVVELLLRNGAKVNAKDNDGRNALMLAVKTVPFVSNWEARARRMTMVSAAKAERQEIVRILLAHGAEVHIKAKDGQTVADAAAHSNNPEIMKMLANRSFPN